MLKNGAPQLTMRALQSTQALRAPQLTTLREMIKDASAAGDAVEKENAADLSVVVASATPEKRSAPTAMCAPVAAPALVRPHAGQVSVSGGCCTFRFH